MMDLIANISGWEDVGRVLYSKIGRGKGKFSIVRAVV